MAKFWGTLSGILAGLRGFGRALKSHRPRTPMPARQAKNTETVPAPPAPVEHRQQSASQGSSKVTLMVVDPYLVYAYWDVDLAHLPAGTQSAVLRFHDATGTAPPFDVDVDLRAPNWYVHLWSPAKSYYAHLGVKTEQGHFVSLAVSNRIETPRAWPAAEVKTTAEPPPAMVPEAGKPLTSAVLPPAKEHASASHGPEVRESVPKPVHAEDVLRQKLGEIYALRSWQSHTALAMAAASSSEIVGSGAPRIASEAVHPETIRTNHVPGKLAPSAPAPAPPDLTALAERGFSPGLPSSPGSPAR